MDAECSCCGTVHSLGLAVTWCVLAGASSEALQTPESLHQRRLPPPTSRSPGLEQLSHRRLFSRDANPHCIFFCALVPPQPLKTMKNVCFGSACGPGSGRGLSGAGSTRSTATSSWLPTFGSPPTVPTAEILSGKVLFSGNLSVRLLGSERWGEWVRRLDTLCKKCLCALIVYLTTEDFSARLSGAWGG